MLRKSLAELDRRRKNPDEKQKGFTLIELLVVIIIIGILAAIAIPVFLNQRQSAWKASVASDLKNAAVVVETYGSAKNGSYAGFPGAGTPVTTAAPGTAGGTANIKVSAGNSLTVELTGTPSGTSFTITGSNSNMTVSGTTNTQLYDSAAGGLGNWR